MKNTLQSSTRNVSVVNYCHPKLAVKLAAADASGRLSTTCFLQQLFHPGFAPLLLSSLTVLSSKNRTTFQISGIPGDPMVVTAPRKFTKFPSNSGAQFRYICTSLPPSMRPALTASYRPQSISPLSPTSNHVSISHATLWPTFHVAKHGALTQVAPVLIRCNDCPCKTSMSYVWGACSRQCLQRRAASMHIYALSMQVHLSHQFQQHNEAYTQCDDRGSTTKGSKCPRWLNEAKSGRYSYVSKPLYPLRRNVKGLSP